ncbi:hypothetical protein [Nocardiopsis sp. JB363]|uniref:hypothetical protein n=1 Tax=Nocardiopsis sp. JB363 TaxID=1434837 RepID=UPI00097A2BA2|nr:hypothetical protein [Nocardiopsis sp. JB363]SIO86967.1 hypothetical protein BQ8420_14505 [Nocardiopsis sp. JB363]
MKATAVSKVLIGVDGTVTLGLTGEVGDIEITVPLSYLATVADSLMADRELAVQLDDETAALAVACLYRVRAIHTRL